MTANFKYRTARSSTLSCAVGKSIADIHAALEPAVDAGLVVACDVTTPAGAMKDYRPAGEAKLPAFSIIAKVEANESRPAPTQAAAMMQELAQTVAPAADPAPAANTPEASPAAALAAAPVVTAKPPATRVRSRQADILAKLTAISPSQLTASEVSGQFSDASPAAIQQALNKLTAAGRISTCKTASGKRGYFVPASAGRRKPAGATAAPPTVERSTAKNKPHREAAARRGGQAPSPAAAAVSCEVAARFTVPDADARFGILSDGTLRIECVIDIDGNGILVSPGNTAALVAYLRKLDMLEGAAA